MYPIIISGDGNDSILHRIMTGVCRRYGGVLAVGDGRIQQTGTARGSQPQFLVATINSLSAADCEGVLIVDKALCQASPQISVQRVRVVANSQQTDVLRFLQSMGQPVIGCSMSDKDTVTVSERSENGALVCIRRTLITLGGHVIEPCEVPAEVSAEVPVFPLLAACTALLLCEVPYEQGYCLHEQEN